MESAIVTGASRGIGFACAEALAKEGMHIVALASSYREEVRERFDRCFVSGYTYVAGDINDRDVRQRLIDEASQREFTMLVNAAGVAPLERRDILEMTEESFDRVMDTNLKSTFFLTQSAAKVMKRGRIITITSVSSYAASVERGEYCMSKAALSMMTELFALRLAPLGIGVYEIRPGVIRTDMTQPVIEKYEKLAKGGVIPRGRLGEASDVAKIVTAVARGDFDYCTGQVFDCDGGFSVRSL